MSYELLKLEKNPFDLMQPLNVRDIVWVGTPEVKAEIEKNIQLSIKIIPSRIIVNFGSYGSGKTHASLYFSKTDRLHNISTSLGSSKVKSIKVTLPRTSNDIVQEFLRSFFGQYSLEEIYDDLQNLKIKIGEEKLKLIINSVSNDLIIANLFYKFVFEIDSVTDSSFSIIKDYIFWDDIKTNISLFNMPLGLKNDDQIANFLGTLISCITYDKKYYSSFIIWLDEFEEINIYSIKLKNQDFKIKYYKILNI